VSLRRGSASELSFLDIMESVFGNIVLPQVQHIDHQSNHHSQKDGSEHSLSAARPVPRQRHELSSGNSTLRSVSVLEKEPEFHASFLNSHPDEEEIGMPVEFRKSTIDRHSSINSHGEQHELASHRSASIHSRPPSEHHEVASHRSISIHSRPPSEHHEVASHKSASVHSHSRRESTISRKSELVYDDVHSQLGEPNEILEPLAPVEVNT
jgi:hypothetical protein